MFCRIHRNALNHDYLIWLGHPSIEFYTIIVRVMKRFAPRIAPSEIHFSFPKLFVFLLFQGRRSCNKSKATPKTPHKVHRTNLWSILTLEIWPYVGRKTRVQPCLVWKTKVVRIILPLDSTVWRPVSFTSVVFLRKRKLFEKYKLWVQFLFISTMTRTMMV